MKYVVQEILPDCKQHCLILLHIKNNGNVLRQLQKKNTASEISSVKRTKQNRLMHLSNGAAYGKKKSSIIKNHEVH